MPIGLTTKELTGIRNDINDLLPDTGYILTNAGTANGMGGVVEAFARSGTVTYRLDPEIIGPLQAKEKVGGGAIEPFHTYVLTMPYDTTVTEQNRFEDAGTNYYNIISVDDPKSWVSSVRCFVEKV
jgi:hypothetical protein